jgi:hypothetical protein
VTLETHRVASPEDGITAESAQCVVDMTCARITRPDTITWFHILDPNPVRRVLLPFVTSPIPLVLDVAINSEDGGSTFIRNTYTCPQHCMTSHLGARGASV